MEIPECPRCGESKEWTDYPHTPGRVPTKGIACDFINEMEPNYYKWHCYSCSRDYKISLKDGGRYG